MTSTALQNIFAKHIHSHDHVRNLLFSRLGSENVWKLKKLLANILEPGSEQESGSEQGSETEQGSGLETEPQSESGLWPSPIKEEGGDVDPGQKEEIIPAALVSVSLSSSERKEGFILPIVETSSLTLKSEKSDASNNTTGRGEICPSRQSRRECKIFASGVNFSIFTHFLCFFLLKLLKLGEIDGVKFLA